VSRLLLTALTALLLSVGAAWAGPVEDGRAASQRDDYATAMRISRTLAAQRYAHAQYVLGVTYYIGKGTAQDYAEAAKWFRLAAAQGSTSAQFNLGTMYDQGQGVEQDYVHAHMWSSLGGASGDGVKNRDLVAVRMTPQQIADAQKMARECQQHDFAGCD
jgi:hypothetical protein